MILGAIIAGGESRRFGTDKALAVLAGRPMIEHVVIAVRPWTNTTIVCGRWHSSLISLPDRPAPGLGPLGGFSAAFRHAVELGYERVLTVPCDTPTISADLITSLTRSIGPAYLADCPVIGIWPAALSEMLDHRIAAGGKRSVVGWACAVGAQALTLRAPPNINLPDDLARIHV